MIEKFPRHRSSWQLLTSLDAGQAGDVDADLCRHVVESLVALQARFTQSSSSGTPGHGDGVCASRKFASSALFAPRALNCLSALGDTLSDMEAKSAEAQQRTVGWAIRQLRIAQNLNQSDLAAVADTDAANLSRLERGRQNFPEDKIRAIAGRLGVTAAELYQIAETGTAEAAAVLGLVATMTPEQAHEVQRFASYVLSRDARPSKD